MSKFLIAFCLLAVVAVKAQQPMIPSQLGQSQVPADAATSNVLTYGASVTSSFDDNVQGASTQAQDMNFISSFQPRATLATERGHLDLNLLYNPTFSYSKNPTYSGNSQTAGIDLTERFTRRLSLRVREGFTFSTNPFQNWQANAELPNPGLLVRPNSSVLGTNVQSTTSGSESDLVYMLDAHTAVGVSGTFTSLKYSGPGSPLSSLAVHSRGWSGSSFYSHLLTPMLSLGVQYSAQHLGSQNVAGSFSSLSHQALALIGFSIRPSFSFSLFAGPEISQFDDQVATLVPGRLGQSSQTSFAGGATVSWQGRHSGMNGNFVRQVGDSGLSGGGAVGVTTLSFQAERQVAKVSTLSFTGIYTSNSQLDPLSLVPLTDSAAAGITYSRQLTDGVSLAFSLLRQQFLGSAPRGFGARSHDVAAVSLSYGRKRPIGR